MARQTISTGTTPGDGTGDSLPSAFEKVNENFTELYAAGATATAAVATEAAARLAADTAEASARAAADVTLQNNINGKAASSHTHEQSEVTGLVDALAAKLPANDASVTNARTPTGGAGGVLSGTYPDPGFAVNMATQAELDAVSAAKANASALTDHTGNTSNPHSVTKAQVGLGNCDNTSDANKPVSSAQQTALDTKAATNQKLDDFGTPDDNTDLNATTGRHGLLPKLGGGTTNFLRADGTWAAPAGGGASASYPKTYFVSASLGNNGTAEVGNPAKPYLTAQVAFNAWHTAGVAGRLHVMDGSVGGITLVADMANVLHVTGNGPASCSLGGFTANGTTPGTSAEDTNGADGTNGFITLITSDWSVNFGAVSCNGGNGGNGGPPTNNTTNGGNGGVCSLAKLYNVLCTSCEIRGGNGGSGDSGDGTHAGGNGGSMADVILIGLKTTGASGYITVTPGVGDAGGYAGTPGTDGSPNSAYVARCQSDAEMTVVASSGTVAGNLVYGITTSGGVGAADNSSTSFTVNWP